MATCLGLLWTDTANRGWCAVSSDGAKIVGKDLSNTFATLNTSDYSTITSLFTRSGSWVGDPAVDADDKIWWLENTSGTVYKLMRADLNGSNITTVLASVSFSPAPSFVALSLAYDPHLDLFWTQTSAPRLWTITKAGIATARFTPPSSSIHYHNPLVDSLGGVWTRWNTKIYRTEGSTFTTLTPGTDSFGTSFAAVSLTLSGNGIVENTGGTDVEYNWTGSAYNAISSACQIDQTAFGFTPSFWTPDYAGIWYYESGASSPTIAPRLWGFFEPQGGPVPLRIYGRNDDLPTGAPIIPPFRSTWQHSGRLRQAAGHA